MDFEQIWAAIVNQNPGYADDSAPVETTVGNLRVMMENAHGLGVTHGHNAASEAMQSIYQAMEEQD
jgi:hypothetical protein